MAKPIKTLYFGKYKGVPVQDIPTDYLMWVYGAFPKLRRGVAAVLIDLGISDDDLRRRRRAAKVLGPVPTSSARRAGLADSQATLTENSGINPSTINSGLPLLVSPMPDKPERKRVKRSDLQKQANDVARAMNREVPFPRYEII